MSVRNKKNLPLEIIEMNKTLYWPIYIYPSLIHSTQYISRKRCCDDGRKYYRFVNHWVHPLIACNPIFIKKRERFVCVCVTLELYETFFSAQDDFSSCDREKLLRGNNAILSSLRMDTEKYPKEICGLQEFNFFRMSFQITLFYLQIE